MSFTCRGRPSCPVSSLGRAAAGPWCPSAVPSIEIFSELFVLPFFCSHSILFILECSPPSPSAAGLSVVPVSLQKPFSRPMLKRRAYGKEADEARRRGTLGQRKRSGMHKLFNSKKFIVPGGFVPPKALDSDGEEVDGSDSDDEEEAPFDPLVVWVSPEFGGDAKGIPDKVQVQEVRTKTKADADAAAKPKPRGDSNTPTSTTTSLESGKHARFWCRFLSTATPRKMSKFRACLPRLFALISARASSSCTSA